MAILVTAFFQTDKSDYWSFYLLHLKDKQIHSKTDDAIRTEIEKIKVC